MNTAPRRILLKLSGEALMGDLDSGIDPTILKRVATEILEGRIKAGDTVQVKVKDKKIYFEVKYAEKA